ncbi:hypothetical protein [Nocardia vinacea]|uniref:hypothetical protein n=1 Tax=Nocardia vinacea TaxID=96468 RepID=UPI00030EECF5|nr:hypothetical protein [Nocardia vinacea]
MTGSGRPAHDRCGYQETPTRRIVIYFEGVGRGSDLALEYAATFVEACEFAAAALRSGLAVTVDRKLRPDLRPLPCRGLWG